MKSTAQAQTNFVILGLAGMAIVLLSTSVYGVLLRQLRRAAGNLGEKAKE